MIFDNSFIKSVLLCNLPAVSMRRISSFFSVAVITDLYARAAGSAAANAGHDPPDTFSQREPLTDQRERRLVLAAQLKPIEVRRQTDVTRQGSRQEREARRELPGRTRCATTGVLPGEGQPRRSGTTSRPPRWKDHHQQQQQQQQQPPQQQQQRLARVRQYV